MQESVSQKMVLRIGSVKVSTYQSVLSSTNGKKHDQSFNPSNGQPSRWLLPHTLVIIMITYP